MKPITVAIAGCGSRGLDTYAACQSRFPEKMKVVAAADIRPEKLEQIKAVCGLTDEQCYGSAEEMLRAGKLADVMMICTQDRQHFAHATAALNLGYHLLLEKPFAVTAQDCKAIVRMAQERGLHVIVCHVLRYTVFYQKLKQLIDAGRVGEVVSVQASEQVGYWHQAHSFVRGNWGIEEKSAPMLLAKCCHDMDILLWLTGKRCRRVSSFGSLRHFRPEFAPEGAAQRCTDGCPAADTCPYNAERFYLGKVREGDTGWPVNILTTQHDEAGVLQALQSGPYGRCVYRCGADVVDHQVVNLLLEDGVTVSFSMCGFSKYNQRDIRIMGTHGEIVGDLGANIIRVLPFVGEEERIDVRTLTDDFSGHAGGDARMLEEFLDLLLGISEGSPSLTSVQRSLESHLVALAGEMSRKRGGEVIDMDTL